MRTAKQRGKKKSLASSAAANFFSGSLPASCVALTPSGCVHAASPWSSPCDPTKARASAPSPRLPRWVSRQASQAGECCSAPSLCAGISPFFPLRPCCCGIRADSHGSLPPLGSVLIAVARAHLWSSFRWHSESPLLVRRETKRQEKVSCLFGSCRLFPGLPPS